MYCHPYSLCLYWKSPFQFMISDTQAAQLQIGVTSNQMYLNSTIKKNKFLKSEIMACRLTSAKTSSEILLEYCYLDPKEQTLLKSWSKFIHFYSRKCIWKCRLENGDHLVSASMCYVFQCCTLHWILKQHSRSQDICLNSASWRSVDFRLIEHIFIDPVDNNE